MIDENFTEFLDDELGRIMPEQQVKYRKLFKEFGFDDRNQYFIDFWVTYSDEIYGKIGYLVDLAMDLEYFDSSQTAILRKCLQVPNNFISLLNNGLDDYLLYNKDTDEVFFIESPEIEKFVKDGKHYAKQWESFETFIKDYLNYQ